MELAELIQDQHFQYKPAWSDDQVSQLLKIYRYIFPKISPKCADYLGFSRPALRWPVLTTNFRNATVEKIRSFHNRLQRLPIDSPSEQTANQLRCNILDDVDVGCSIGLNPWADHLLHKTFAHLQTKCLVVVVGHDWYPIIYEDEAGVCNWSVNSPLYKAPIGPPYWEALQPFMSRDRHTALLFLNLVPDARPPLTKRTGRIPKIDYHDCAEGFRELLGCINPLLSLRAVISWGTDTWKSLRQSTTIGVTMATAKTVSAGPFKVAIDNTKCVDYYPFSHPCNEGNFQRLLSGACATPSGSQTRHDEWYRKVAQIVLI